MSPSGVISVLVVFFCLTSIEGRAFKNEKARLKRQAGERCHGGVIEDDVGEIDIGFGQYENNEDCCFELRPFFGGYFTVELEFNDFDIENGPGCRFDSITYRSSDGNIEIDCGTKNPGYTRFFNSTGSFQLCFHSDSSVVHRGINLYYYIYPENGTSPNTVVATGNMIGSPCNGIVAPDNTTAAPGNTTVAPSNTTVAPGNTTVAPGNTTAAPGNTTAAPGNTTVAPGNTTAAPGTTTAAPGNGTIASVCNYDTTALEGTIELATDGDGFYANNDECRINLYSPALPHVTTITFIRFDVEYARNCTYDSLSVSYGDNAVDRLCGNNRGPFVKQYTSTEPLLVLTFTSDYSVTGLGFSFHYKTEIVT